jgi:hypothetical protein
MPPARSTAILRGLVEDSGMAAILSERPPRSDLVGGEEKGRVVHVTLAAVSPALTARVASEMFQIVWYPHRSSL